jgi:site-specific DNA-methyltransferase (adenine-specific)
MLAYACDVGPLGRHQHPDENAGLLEMAAPQKGEAMMCLVITGDCRHQMPDQGPFDMILADPPYGDTSLEWDHRVDGWLLLARASLKPTGSMWVFGSMRFFMATASDFRAAGWRYAQDVVWEKHNGSGFHADRFKRVHEHVVQFYRDDAPWAEVYNDVQTTDDATKKTVRRKKRPTHTGHIEATHYVSEDGGPRIMRSVLYMRSMHGRAIHPTEKPAPLLEVLVRTSCPPGGLVGDWFAGSGAAGEASAITGRRYVGCEIDEVMASKANARLGGNLFGASALAAIS